MELLYSVAGLLLAICLGQAQLIRNRPRPECAEIQCGVPLCGPDETLELSPGACCPGCVRRLRPPIDCSVVRCAFPECLTGEPYTPPGQCCPVCPDSGCVYKGKYYREGETFKDNCNTCTCRNGRAGCTKKFCLPFNKPGQCPRTRGRVGICVEECSGDRSCPGKQKCCSNGCGHKCMRPVPISKGCLHNGVFHAEGEAFKDDCNMCHCSNGIVICTKVGCLSKRACLHNGNVYKHRESFKDDCNTCRCSNGRAMCTKRACPPIPPIGGVY